MMASKNLDRSWVHASALDFLNSSNNGTVDLTKDQQWVRRALARFDSMDSKGVGELSIDHVKTWINELNLQITLSSKERVTFTERIKEMFEDMGFTEEPMQRKDFPCKFNIFAAKERKRKRLQQETLHGKCTDLMFQIIDTNNDGQVSLEELQIRMQSVQLPKTVADAYFKMADKDANGYIDIEELKDVEFRFWFEPIDKSLDHLYGGYFSGNDEDLTKDKKWVRRVLRYFDYIDSAGDGNIYLEDILSGADYLVQACKTGQSQLSKVKKELKELFAEIFASDSISRRTFLKNFNIYGVRERERKGRNEETLHYKANTCIFDAIDENNAGKTSEAELKIRNKIMGIPEEVAKHLIKMANPNEKGEVEISTLLDLEFKFWFEAVDDQFDFLYGSFFSGIDLTENSKWVKRVLGYFDSIDRDSDGVVYIDDITELTEFMREPCQATKAEMKALKKCYKEVYGDMGFTKFGMTRKSFPNSFNRFAERERERKCLNQETLHSKLMYSLFDVIDSDNDGHLTLPEMKVRMQATGTAPEAAKHYLELADENQNGTVEIDELINIEFRFWFEPIDDQLDDLYGGSYSGNDVNLIADHKWVRRALCYFESLDIEGQGLVTLKQIEQMVDFMKKPCQATQEEMNQLKKCMREFYGDIGFTDAGMKRENFTKNFNSFAERERKRRESNQITLHKKLMHALFDVIDIDKDGHITLEEMQIRMQATGMPKSTAKHYLKMADKDQNGTVELEELIDIEFRFWFQPVDKSLDMLYGGKYSGGTHFE